METPYPLQERLQNLERAVVLATQLDLDSIVDMLVARIAELRAGTCALIDAVAPDILYQNHWKRVEEETLAEDFEDDPDLLAGYEQPIRALYWLVCVANSEQMADAHEELFLRLGDFHPASPMFLVPGLQFHFDNAPVSVDREMDNAGAMDLILGCVEWAEGLRVERDAPMTVSLQKEPYSLVVRYTDGDSGSQRQAVLPMKDLEAFAQAQGESDLFVVLRDALTLRFGTVQ